MIRTYIFHNDALLSVSFSENHFSQGVAGEIKFRKKYWKAHVVRVLKFVCFHCLVVVGRYMIMTYIVRIEICVCSLKNRNLIKSVQNFTQNVL